MTAPGPVVYKTARPAYMTVEAFGQHFGISKMGAYRLCHAGEVTWLRIGRQMRIPVSEVPRYAKTAEQAAKTEVWELAAEEEE